MTNFRRGDRVRAVHTDSTNLDPDRVYTVAHVEPAQFGGQYVQVEEYGEVHNFRSTRFEHVTETNEMRPGDLVVCVDAEGHSLLHEGVVYTVSDEQASMDDLFYVKGVEEPVLRDRFVKILLSNVMSEEEAEETFTINTGGNITVNVMGEEPAPKEPVDYWTKDTFAEALWERERPVRKTFEEKLAKFTEAANYDTVDNDVDPEVNEYLRRYDRFGPPVTTHILRDGPFSSLADICSVLLEIGDDFDLFKRWMIDLRKHALAQYEVKRDNGGFEEGPEPVDLVHELYEVVRGEPHPGSSESPKEVWEDLLEGLQMLLGEGGLQQWRENLDDARQSVAEAKELNRKQNALIDSLTEDKQALEHKVAKREALLREYGIAF